MELQCWKVERKKAYKVIPIYFYVFLEGSV